MASSYPNSPHWPQKYNLCGVNISATTPQAACAAIVAAAQRGEAAVVSAFDVHAVIEAATNATLGRAVNRFAMITPDGQPVRWGLNWLHGTGLRQRVYGPDLTLAVCQQAAEEGVPVYLYGGAPAVLEKLQANLLAKFPGLRITGAESPPFRELSAEEDTAMIDRVNASGAGVLFIGLGCPKQDFFAAKHAAQLRPVQVCVGAAFDFLAGAKSQAPVWMQRRGLEWLYRLFQEPRRLWRRYLLQNPRYIFLLVRQKLNGRSFQHGSNSVAVEPLADVSTVQTGVTP